MLRSSSAKQCDVASSKIDHLYLLDAGRPAVDFS
jgi:hypothetical protein